MYQLMFDFLPYVSLSLSFTSETESSGCQARTSVRPSALLLPSKENYHNLFQCFRIWNFFFSLFPSIFFHFSFFGSTLPFSFLLYLCVNRLLYVSVYVVSYQTIFRHLCICSSVVHFWLYMQQPIFPAVAAVLMYFNFTLIVFFFYNPVFDICT